MEKVDQILCDIFAAHDVTLTLRNGWLTTNDSYPACQGLVHKPRDHGASLSVRVDVRVAINEHQTIIESFSDSGSTLEEALEDFRYHFAAGSLHVMLSALWNNHDEDQVLQETWNIDGRDWDVYMGNIVRKAADGADIPPPNDLIPILEQLICKTEFTPEVHWLRLYYANVNAEEQVVEVLLDNMKWDFAQDHLRNASWPHSEAFYSARMFVIFTIIS